MPQELTLRVSYVNYVRKKFYKIVPSSDEGDGDDLADEVDEPCSVPITLSNGVDRMDCARRGGFRLLPSTAFNVFFYRQ